MMMLYEIKLIAFLALACCVSGCHLGTSAKSRHPGAVRPHAIYAADIGWKQSGWGAGPGVSEASAEDSYLFAGGLEAHRDGSIALSRLDAASKTCQSDLNGDGYSDIGIANSGNYEFVDQPFAQIRRQ